MTGKRSFVSVSAAFKAGTHHVWTNGKLIVTGVVFAAEGIPRIVDSDFDTRGVAANAGSYLKDGIVCEKSSTIRKASQLLHHYPEDKVTILRENSCTVDPIKVDKQIAQRNLKVVDGLLIVDVNVDFKKKGEIVHEHKLSLRSWSWKDFSWWSKK